MHILPSFKVIFILAIPPKVILVVSLVVVYVFSPVAEDKSVPLQLHSSFPLESYAYAPPPLNAVTVILYPADGIVIVHPGPLLFTVPAVPSYVPPA